MNNRAAYVYPPFVTSTRKIKKVCDIGHDQEIYLSEVRTKYGERRLDIRIWKDGEPMRNGFFLTMEKARILYDLIGEYMNTPEAPADPKYQTLSQLGFNPWTD